MILTVYVILFLLGNVNDTGFADQLMQKHLESFIHGRSLFSADCVHSRGDLLVGYDLIGHVKMRANVLDHRETIVWALLVLRNSETLCQHSIIPQN